MKKLIILLAVIAINYTSQAQDFAPVNTIPKAEATINGIQILGAHPYALIYGGSRGFGYGYTSSTHYSEIDDATVSTYKYDGAEFEILNSKIEGFKITSNQYSFTRHNIRVGQNIARLQYIYPKSYRNKRTGAIDLYIRYDYDDYITIAFDPTTRLITGIYQ